jgi:competence protein ComEA
MRTMRHPIAAVARAAVLATCLSLCLSTSALAAGNERSISGVVNVNSATAEELSLLPGVGPAKAQAIIRWRTEHGAFKRVEDLSQVKGIGDKQLEKMRPHVALEGKTTVAPK